MPAIIPDEAVANFQEAEEVCSGQGARLYQPRSAGDFGPLGASTEGNTLENTERKHLLEPPTQGTHKLALGIKYQNTTLKYRLFEFNNMYYYFPYA